MESKLRMLFVIEGNTDIRFVDGLSRHFELTLLVPKRQFESSGLKDRINKIGLTLSVHEMGGGRIGYQIQSFLWLFKHAKAYQVILAQEMLRGALNATLAGFFLKIPVVTYVGIPAVEYFDCRWERGQISWWRWQLGRNVIKALLRINGRLATAGFGMGDFHRKYIQPFVKKSYWASYYGVNLKKFTPADSAEKRRLRKALDLPENAFLVLFASRMSHEKDPETLLLACQQARFAGAPIQILNLGGGFAEFQNLSRKILGEESAKWITGRSAINPMEELADYYRACDVLVQSSLQEGVAFCTMEALACQLPVIATDVGGMKDQLGPYAQLIRRRDFSAMSRALLGFYRNPATARERAFAGQQWVQEVWESEKGFVRFEEDLRGLVSAERER